MTNNIKFYVCSNCGMKENIETEKISKFVLTDKEKAFALDKLDNDYLENCEKLEELIIERFKKLTLEAIEPICKKFMYEHYGHKIITPEINNISKQIAIAIETYILGGK